MDASFSIRTFEVHRTIVELIVPAKAVRTQNRQSTMKQKEMERRAERESDRVSMCVTHSVAVVVMVCCFLASYTKDHSFDY